MKLQMATIALVFMAIVQPIQAQGQAGVRDTTLDLTHLADGRGWAVFNRQASLMNDGQIKNGIYLDAKPGQGVAWLPGIEVMNGAIELDMKGKNVPQRSFIGLAFHGESEDHYEAIYLRPFNFRAESEASRSHSIQYISTPSHEWRRLRTAHPGQYEAALEPAPDPDGWFHLRVELDGRTVRAFINRAEKPALEVDRIGAAESGWIGFWVGHQSDGTFANLRVEMK